MMRYGTRWCGLALALVLLFHLTGWTNVLAQQPSGQNQVETTSKPPFTSLPDYIIGPGDLLSISVFQQPDLSGDVRVSTQGYIRLLFIEKPIKAAGYTEWELADIIRDKLRVILREPQVTVQVKEGRQDVAYILGAVQTPSSVPVRSDTRLLNLLAAANGLSDRAGNVAYILRAKVWSAEHEKEQTPPDQIRLSSVLETVPIREMLQGRVDLNKRIYPGDVVSVPEADKVFVGGSVNNPDAFELRTTLSLTQAITLAGGTKPDAKKSEVTIVRQEPGKSDLTQIIVDLSKIEKNPSQDIKLQANDVVFVPSSSMRRFGLALMQAAVTQFAVVLPFLLVRR